MRLYAYEDDVDGPSLGLLEGERVVPLPFWDVAAALLEGDDLGRLRRIADRLRGAAGLALGDLTPAVPLEPGKVVCIGLNYRDHIEEQHIPVPERPQLFAKFGNAIVADGEPIVRPPGTHALDLEVELGVVIGRTARRVRPSTRWITWPATSSPTT